MKCRFFYYSTLLFLLSFLVSCNINPKTKSQTNVVVFLLDDMEYIDSQCYMPSSITPTSNIDLLASQGIRFTDANASSSVCAVARYSILTARYAWCSAVKKEGLGRYNNPWVGEDRLTAPKILKEKGYTTALFKKYI